MKTRKAADIAAEMQRHVLPLRRATKTWLANTPNTCKPRVEGLVVFYWIRSRKKL